MIDICRRIYDYVKDFYKYNSDDEVEDFIKKNPIDFNYITFIKSIDILRDVSKSSTEEDFVKGISEYKAYIDTVNSIFDKLGLSDKKLEVFNFKYFEAYKKVKETLPNYEKFIDAYVTKFKNNILKDLNNDFKTDDNKESNNMLYRRQPIEVQAFQFSYKTTMSDINNAPLWFIKAIEDGVIYIGNDNRVYINNSAAVLIVHEGDYIIQSFDNEVYTCDPERFARTYEKVDG